MGNSTSPFFMQCYWPCLTSYRVSMQLYIMRRVFLKWLDFNKADAISQSVYIGGSQLFFTLLAMTVIDKFGRKICYLSDASV